MTVQKQRKAFLWAFKSDLIRLVKKQGQDYGHQQHIYGRKVNAVFTIHC